ncbi:MAG: ATP-binding protein, partial [Candidatus Woesearchaeota archaeon]|nr:ATP-binding protein [Candidatus Woesearchaeota archaeon]
INIEDIKSYLQRYEDENLEFKSTLLWNIIGKLKDKKIEESVLKTIAGFNNSEGGVLLIGVDDQKKVIGLNYDLQEGSLLDIDKFEIHLRNIMMERLIIDDWYISKNVKIKFEQIDNKTICIVNVKKGNKPIYTKDNKFFIRSGNSTIELAINEIYEYIKNSFES